MLTNTRPGIIRLRIFIWKTVHTTYDCVEALIKLWTRALQNRPLSHTLGGELANIRRRFCCLSNKVYEYAIISFSGIDENSSLFCTFFAVEKGEITPLISKFYLDQKKIHFHRFIFNLKLDISGTVESTLKWRQISITSRFTLDWS